MFFYFIFSLLSDIITRIDRF